MDEKIKPWFDAWMLDSGTEKDLGTTVFGYEYDEDEIRRVIAEAFAAGYKQGYTEGSSDQFMYGQPRWPE